MTGFRKFLLNVHLWVGFAAAALLFILGATGALITYEPQLDHMLNPSLAYVTPQTQRLPLAQLAQSVQQQYPNGRIMAVELSASSPSPDLAYSFSVLQGKERWQVFVDQYTGRVLGARQPQNTFMSKMHQLHIRLLGGPKLRTLLTWASVIQCLLALTGIYLWWPRKIFTANFSGNFRRLNFDLHNSVGLYASIFVFIFAFTAVVIHWEEEFYPIANALTHSNDDAPDPRLSSTPVPGQPPASLDQLYENALAQAAGTRVTMIGAATKPTDVVRVWLKFPDDGTPAGRTWALLDQYSGKVLFFRNAHTAPLGTRYMKQWNREIHTGDIFGWKSKIVAFLASLSIVFLSVSGPLIWILKRKKSKASTGLRAEPVEAQAT